MSKLSNIFLHPTKWSNPNMIIRSGIYSIFSVLLFILLMLLSNAVNMIDVINIYVFCCCVVVYIGVWFILYGHMYNMKHIPINELFNEFIKSMKTWITENKIRLICISIISIICSLLPWSYNNYSVDSLLVIFPCLSLPLSLSLWFLSKYISIDDVIACIKGIGFVLYFLLSIIIGIVVLYVGIKIVKFMWYC